MPPLALSSSPITLLRRAVLLLACLTVLAQAQTSKTGAILLVGGGANRPAYMDKFMALAGPNPHIVVIPTALPDSELTAADQARILAAVQRRFGPGATLLHTRDRKTADSKEFTAPLRRASAVWMLGGSEFLLADAYVGTRTELEIKDVVARGGVVGGTSAGAILLGSLVVHGKLSPASSGNPEKLSILGTMPAFDLLPGSVVIPHWSQRQVNSDLLALEHAHDPSLLAIGIDEDTAALVQGNSLEVLGDHHVGIYDGRLHDGRPYLLLSSGQSYDLGKRAPLPSSSSALLPLRPAARSDSETLGTEH